MSSVIEVPDWYRTVALVGVDLTGTPVVVLLDSTGAIMAVMKGEYAGTLKNIAVDASGRIVSVIRDPTSDNYIAIDANGYIAAVLKATYSGALKDVACDAEGRIIMIPTDPADVWGNAISMGNAELAARLGFPGSWEGSGQVILIDDFESGKAKGVSAVDGTGAAVEASSTISRFGGLSLSMTAGSDSTKLAEYDYILPYPTPGKLGVQCSFTVDTYTQYFQVHLRIYDGSNLHRAYIRYDHVNGKVEYYDSAGDWQELISGVSLYAAVSAFHCLKVVVDFANDKYYKVYLDGWSWTAGNLSIRTTGSNTSKRCFGWLTHYGVQSNPSINVDGVVFTQNEPA